MSRWSVERTNEYLRVNPGQQTSYVAQMPRVTCTFTGNRSVYITRRDQATGPSAQLTQTHNPTHPARALSWLSGMYRLPPCFYQCQDI